MITDPRFAPKRTDLPWLRRRRVPRSVAATPERAHEVVTDFVSGRAARHEPAAEPPPARVHEAVTDFVTGHAHHEHAKPPSSAASSAASPSLDLDAPATPVAPASRAPTPAVPTPPAPSSSSSLDLDEPAPAPPRRVEPPAASSPGRRVRTDERVRAGGRMILTVADPTVTLTRLQSGIGTLTFEAACSPEVGDLRIGCAYELNSGPTSTVQLTQGNRMGPPRSRRPVLVAAHERFETIAVDLRQCTDLRRLVVYAFSESRSPLTWGGTLITTTFGGARVELPLESLQSGDAAVLLSLYNVRGEFVLRAEMQTLFGDVREACRTYGFDKITWLDDRTPVE